MYRAPENQTVIKPEQGVIYGTFDRKALGSMIRDLSALIDDDREMTFRVRLSPEFLTDGYKVTIDFGRSAFGTDFVVSGAEFVGAEITEESAR